MNIRQVGALVVAGVLGLFYWAGMRVSVLPSWHRGTKVNLFHVSIMVYGPRPAKQQKGEGQS